MVPLDALLPVLVLLPVLAALGLLPVLAALLLQPALAALALLPKLLPALVALLPAVSLLAASRLAAVG